MEPKIIYFGIFWWLWRDVAWNIISLFGLHPSLFRMIYWAGVGGAWVWLEERRGFHSDCLRSRWGWVGGIGAGMLSGGVSDVLWLSLHDLLQVPPPASLDPMFQFLLFGWTMGLIWGIYSSRPVLLWKAVGWAAVTALSWIAGGFILWTSASLIGRLCPGLDCFSSVPAPVRMALWWGIIATVFIAASAALFWAHDQTAGCLIRRSELGRPGSG